MQLHSLCTAFITWQNNTSLILTRNKTKLPANSSNQLLVLLLLVLLLLVFKRKNANMLGLQDDHNDRQTLQNDSLILIFKCQFIVAQYAPGVRTGQLQPLLVQVPVIYDGDGAR